MSDLRFSRPVLAAAKLGALAPDSHRFVDKRVLLTGESLVLSTPNGRACLLGSLRLLVRICPNVEILLPTGSEFLRSECRELAARIEFGKPVCFPEEMADLSGFDAILSVGMMARPELPWTVINSNGWLARVSSSRQDLPSTTEQTNPIGALGAASLGVAEVFKRLIRLKERRGRLFDGLAFSLHSCRCGENDPGPALPENIPLSLLLIGAGAIGNGIIYLLYQMPISGHVWIVDHQEFEDENLGTCLLIGPADVGTPKASLAEQLLNKRVAAKGFREELSAFKNRLGHELPFPAVVMTALDNIEARHEAQAIWPDMLIDGAIGDFLCQASRHQWGDDGACLVCLVRRPQGDSAEAIQCAATGLALKRVQQPDSVVTEEDVRIAPPERKEFLLDRLGRQVCSVIQEGVAQQISQENQRQGFAPSTPFVASLSACMSVGHLVRFVTDSDAVVKTRFQFDVLCGPQSGIMQPQIRRADCDCVSRAHNINTWRRNRRSNPRELQTRPQ